MSKLRERARMAFPAESAPAQIDETIYGSLSAPVPRRQMPAGALVPVDGQPGYIQAGRFTLTPVGVDLTGMSADEWGVMGEVITRLDTSLQWIIGDWAAYAIREFGETYESIAAVFGLDAHTISTYVSVCNSFPIATRIAELSFGHHRLVQGMSDRQRTHWLSKAVESKWAVKQLSAAIKKSGRKSDPPAPLFSDPALKRGKRLFSREEEAELANRLKALAGLRTGVGQASQSARKEIHEMADGIRRWLDEVENMIAVLEEKRR